MKKILSAVSGGALAFAVLSCNFAFEDKPAESAGTRLYSGTYREGYYAIKFKNGNLFKDKISGYDLEPDGKTTLYDYYNSEVEEVSKALDRMNIPHEMHKTPTGSVEYGWNRFDTSLLYGVGSWSRSYIRPDELNIYYDYPTPDDIYTVQLDSLAAAVYAKPFSVVPEGTDYSEDRFEFKPFKGVSKFQETNPRAVLVILFMDNKDTNPDNMRYIRQSPLEILYSDDRCVALDAANIRCFAYNWFGLFDIE